MGLAVLPQRVPGVRMVLVLSPLDIWTPLFLPSHLPGSWQTPRVVPKQALGQAWSGKQVSWPSCFYSSPPPVSLQLGVGS